MDDVDLWQVLDRERAELADLFFSLTEEQWAVPSLCAGWTVREVAAHLTLGPRATLGWTVIEAVRARGNFDRMVDRTARKAAAAPTARLVADLRGAAGSRRLAPGQNLRHAVLDVLVHGQDIAVPLGLDRSMPPGAARLSADHIWSLRFPFHARRRLAGLSLVATDLEWAAGAGAEIRGPINRLLMLMAGRRIPLDVFSGDGVAELSVRR